MCVCVCVRAGGGASSTCAIGEQLEITHIQPLVKRENTGLTGCFSG